jgi:hypothetical protein
MDINLFTYENSIKCWNYVKATAVMRRSLGI